MRNEYEFSRNKVLKNMFFGATITKALPIDEEYTKMDFLSIEPLLGPLSAQILLELLRQSCIKVLIIGAETGRRKDKVIPQKEWVDGIVSAADEYGTPVFMKSSLLGIMGENFRQDRLPWEIRMNNKR